ncbi:hypothetical protein EDM00_06440 [Ornithobacterium rhinotracheale]|uniref:hypothetical protein n=1 Tax=Ornithobacterium rhinotracheale TaxID=28251 RepID=UPI00129CEDD2|nr:hypothetical protein [Ornithobacterium rhinotracheale]MRI63627.1 hypothetical protein [Ornithobacterium rhinotracheale]
MKEQTQQMSPLISLKQKIDEILTKNGLPPVNIVKEPQSRFEVLLKRAKEKTKEELHKEREQVLETVKAMAMNRLGLTEEEANAYVSNPL